MDVGDAHAESDRWEEPLCSARCRLVVLSKSAYCGQLSGLRRGRAIAAQSKLNVPSAAGPQELGFLMQNAKTYLP
jgi:hypothetical protein